MRIFFFMAILSASFTVAGQEHFLLAGTYTRNDSKGIYLYRFNSNTGSFTEVGTSAMSNPSYLAIDSRNNRVYAVSENGDGTGAVNAYGLDTANHAFSLINTQPSHGDGPCYAAIDKQHKWVTAGNYTGGNFSIYPVTETGELGAAVQTIQHSGSGANPQRQEKPHVHSTVFSPDQKWLAVTDLGTDRIMFYPFDASKEKPVGEQGVEIKATPGSGPRHLIFHPELPYFYSLEELSGTVAVYHQRGSAFRQVQRISSHPQGYTGDVGSAAIKLSPDGRFLYASNRGGSNTIAAFGIKESTGKISLIDIKKTEGQGPRDFVIDPSGKYLLSANTSSGTITIFSRNIGNGRLTGTGKEIRIPDPVFVEFLDAR